jgi:predicted flap endonuclease-1-like 5' DNA nuclease
MEKDNMRSDYMLYVVAMIFFILTGVVAYYYSTEQQLWIVTTAVLGLAFIGLGYTQRPKPTSTTATISTVTTPPPAPETTAIAAPAPPPPTLAQPTVTEIAKEKTAGIIAETRLPTIELTSIKGIKTKRATQLKALGINTLDDLAKASATELGTKLQISPKITGKWIENAKEMLAKS